MGILELVGENKFNSHTIVTGIIGYPMVAYCKHHFFLPSCGKRVFSEAMTHYESTPFNAKPMELKEESDHLFF